MQKTSHSFNAIDFAAAASFLTASDEALEFRADILNDHAVAILDGASPATMARIDRKVGRLARLLKASRAATWTMLRIDAEEFLAE